jgi:uncharacterized membrane protein YhaH (DUF805 family)
VRHRVALPLDAAAVAAGLAATALASVWVARVPGQTAFLTLAGPAAFAAAAVLFARRPHIAFAAIIPLFVFTPMLKVFVDDRIGALKDVLVVAASVAAAAVFLKRRVDGTRGGADTVVLVIVAFIATMYVLNVGGNLTGGSAYGSAWFHGVRLRVEPLLLFVAALVLPNPQRSLRYAAISTIFTACVVSIYGLMQQVLGEERLVGLGYEYGRELRTIEGQLRSFGTFDTPFTYAAFLALALGLALLWPLRTSVRLAALSLIVAGLASSLVRTTAVIAVALLALWIARWGYRRAAVLLAAVAVIGGLAVFSSLESRTTRTVQASPSLYLTLNGRTTIWQERLGGDYPAWLFGEGVGAAGTAAIRAQASSSPDVKPDPDLGYTVDSGYFVTILDIGVAGLVLTILLFGRIALVARRAASRGEVAGWVALAVLVTTVFTAVTAEIFTDFPNAYLAMLLLGLAYATAQSGGGAEPPRLRRARPRT